MGKRALFSQRVRDDKRGGDERICMRCRNTEEIVREINRIIREEQEYHPEDGAEFFFRGESKNYNSESDSDELGTSFPCCLDREKNWIHHEREMYEEALRMNVASFREDVTMVERLARMQHYQLPTRFADISFNALLSTHFACGGGNMKEYEKDNGRDGFVRVIKIAKHKMKSFTSDIITAISYLPLVDYDKINPSIQDGLDGLVYEIKKSYPTFSYEREIPKQGEALRNQIRHVWAFKPIVNSNRLRSQGGVFLAFGCLDNKEPLKPTFAPSDYDDSTAPSYGIKQIGYVQIHAESKATIREELRRFGMAEEIAYPELSNICSEIQNRFMKGK